jgi:fatty-acyl-CoA synthase
VAGRVVSTMQEHPLTITDLMRHGATVYAGSVVTTWEGRAAAGP